MEWCYMDPMEEKAREILGLSLDGKDDDSHRSHDIKRILSDSIPLDLTLEIFSRLPAKSILRSLCVSKLWYSFIKHQSFINFFASRSSSLLLTFHKDKKLFVFSFPQHQNLDGSYPPVESYQMENPKDWTFTQLESVHGIIHGLMFLRDPKIWNPTMRQFFSLPKPKGSSEGGIYLLAYEPLEGKHKVLCIFCHDPQQPLVFTIGATWESWRNTKEDCPTHYPTFSAKCINGILYYKAFFGVGRSHAIMSFDARSEKFNMIKFPEDYILGSNMVRYEERLALVPSYDISADKVDLWILKDAARHEWTRTRFLLPLYEIDTVWKADLKLRGITEAGELIYVPRTLSESVHILYVDLKTNSIREALFEGVFDDDFTGKNGLKGYRISDVDIFPNHINNIRSCDPSWIQRKKKSGRFTSRNH